MQLKYIDFKEKICESQVFLPYKFVLETLESSGKIKKLTHSFLHDDTYLDYKGDDIVMDICSIRKNFYIVSVEEDNMPKNWLRFNEVLSDLTRQARSNVSFYVPYYDLNAAMYFKVLSKIKIEKNMIVYSPEKHFDIVNAKKAILELNKSGFKCRFSSIGNHAKAYIFDKKAAVVGSFNFTDNGIYKNNELGVLLFGDEVSILSDFLERKTNPI
jgi:hypothetical protein